MKLKETLLNHAGEQVKIGAQSSFIYCGIAEGAFDILDKMSAHRLEELKKQLDEIRRKNEMFDKIWTAKTDAFLRQTQMEARSKRWNEIKTAERMSGAVRMCDRKKNADRIRIARLLETLPVQIENFKGFEERRVRKEYESLEGGTIILIEGHEVGSYWTYEEYERGKE